MEFLTGRKEKNRFFAGFKLKPGYMMLACSKA